MSNVTDPATIAIAINNADVGQSRSDEALVAAILSNVFLFLLIFGLSATVETKSLRHQLGNKLALVTGCAMQFILLPFLGYIAVLSMGSQYSFTKAMGLSLLVVTASPGGSYSNWWCSLFNADLALAVTMTTGSTILSIGMLPANLLLYSHLAYGRGQTNVLGALDFGALFLSLGIVIGAIVTGLYASYTVSSKAFRRWANRGATGSGIALVLVSFLLSTQQTESRLWAQHYSFYAAVAIPCIVSTILSTIAARRVGLTRPECVSLAIGCCYQNTGIATSVAINMFQDPVDRAQAVAIPLFYGILEAIVIVIYCLWAWKVGWTKAPKDEKLCVILATSYEVVDDDAIQVQVHDDLLQDEGVLNDVEEQGLVTDNKKGNNEILRARAETDETTITIASDMEIPVVVASSSKSLLTGVASDLSVGVNINIATANQSGSLLMGTDMLSEVTEL